MRWSLGSILRGLPFVQEKDAEIAALQIEKAALEAELRQYKTWVPPGHFYSPLHDLSTIRSRAAELFPPPPAQFAAIDLNEAVQWEWLSKVEAIYAEIPWGEAPRPPLRYHFGLNQYHYMDAITYWGMLAALRPRRVVEVGVGHSSMVLLDARDRLFGGQLQAEFIDPFPALLEQLLPPEEVAQLSLRRTPLQQVPADFFAGLAAGDMLFIDSTHVSKTGSDVNYLFFEILPRLAGGVVVHLHDIFFPFEYPQENIYFGIAWQELYLLRAFLEFNSAYEILLWPHLLVGRDRPRFERAMPLTLNNTGGSIYLRRR